MLICNSLLHKPYFKDYQKIKDYSYLISSFILN